MSNVRSKQAIVIPFPELLTTPPNTDKHMQLDTFMIFPLCDKCIGGSFGVDLGVNGVRCAMQAQCHPTNTCPPLAHAQ